MTYFVMMQSRPGGWEKKY